MLSRFCHIFNIYHGHGSYIRDLVIEVWLLQLGVLTHWTALGYSNTFCGDISQYS